MKRTTTATTLLLLLCSFLGYSQSMEASRTTNWIGDLQATISAPQGEFLNLNDFGIDRNGNQSIDKALTSAINQLQGSGGIIFIPEGTYLINSTIELSSNVWIAGAGSEKTHLKLDLNGAGHGFLAKGSIESSRHTLKNCGHAGAEEITPVSGDFKAGDLILVSQQENTKMTSSWAKNSMGQLVRVKSVVDGTLLLSQPLRFDAHVADYAFITKIDAVENCGIVNLSIERMDQTTTQTDNIRFEYTSGAVVYGVKSTKTNFSHVNNVFAHETYIYGSHFSESHDYGGGGKGYGVTLAFSSSACVLENNIFNTLRHSILFQAGSNGNVVGYNYSTDPYWTGTAFPESFAGDIVMHGNYPFFNLIEGNTIQNLVIDNSHGTNGPNNTFFRNRVEHAGIFVDPNSNSDQQNFIGNEVTSFGLVSNGTMAFPKGIYSVSGNDHYEFANNVNGTFLPQKGELSVKSFYLTSNADYLGLETFPIIGYPNEIDAKKLPAEQRYAKAVTTLKYPLLDIENVKILNFNLTNDSKKADLVWEINESKICRQVEVFRTSNHQSPDQIALLDCGTSSNGNTYTQTDYQLGELFETTEEIGYYIQVNLKDGSSVKSETLYATMQSSSVHFNPRNRELIIPGQLTENVNVYDAQGRLVYEHRTRTEEIQLPDHLQTGVYYVSYNYRNHTQKVDKIFIAGK